MASTITYFTHLARDANGNVLPVAAASTRLGCVTISGTGDLPAPVPAAATVARLATDEVMAINIAGKDAPGDAELFMPGVEFFEVIGGTTLSVEPL